MAWFDAEIGTIQAVIAHAAATDGLEPYAWRLALECAVHLRRSGRRAQRAAVHGLARSAAARVANRPAWATATRRLADALSRLNRTEEARRLLYAALRECRALEDQEGIRDVRLSLVRMYASRGDHRRALPHARLALAMAERTADPLALADGLTAVAQQQERLGLYTSALEHGRRALGLYARLGHLDGRAGILLCMGQAEQALGRHSDAIGHFESSLALDRTLGDRYREAHALDHLADAHAALGRHRESRGLLEQALAVLDGMHHPDAEPVRAKLHRGAVPPGT
jgi:tetratricopeptide (TPR) repeat protein